MSSPNIVLSVWQLTVMAVVPVVLLFGWLIVVLYLGRETRVQDRHDWSHAPVRR